MADEPKKELSEEEQKRLNKQAITELTMICLEHGVKIEDVSPRTLKLFIAIYVGGMAAGLKEAMKQADPKDIQF